MVGMDFVDRTACFHPASFNQSTTQPNWLALYPTLWKESEHHHLLWVQCLTFTKCTAVICPDYSEYLQIPQPLPPQSNRHTGNSTRCRLPSKWQFGKAINTSPTSNYRSLESCKQLHLRNYLIPKSTYACCCEFLTLLLFKDRKEITSYLRLPYTLGKQFKFINLHLLHEDD